ncbi:UDP-N-acetylglucosamine 2-epimerase (hydrolyzing) [Algoriphagus kandeliae]|uniref:UDP-N-acetylglucosamine 2-epimerase (Hydrolyzing) n=1 Tax=Algoriphagus kandeliae TaxID=2562278 RepID=A0A4Y9QY04_9BACT|nr:UDP-N-acetylglucosamine 2-epimerase [Algoriphagus kandeliae]TFV97229.1 UDP-N-acetylglucosamine 2-epimerase (hydrolyzing) [Algoriphagus kandeliae]
MKRILFLTGTRADFGKIKSLIEICDKAEQFEVDIFVTGMHMHKQYGETVIEIERCGFSNLFKFFNYTSETTMDLTLAKTIDGFSGYIKENKPDLIIVHGDRVEALAGAIVGALNNILVGHIEGGEVSGTIDELIRHSVSKLSHFHFVSNDLAKKRLVQMGELESQVFVIGSPDIDVMFSNSLPELVKVKEYYQIPFDRFSVVLFHPVTTEVDQIEGYANVLAETLLKDSGNYVVIFPNNDMGTSQILKAYGKFNNHPRFKVFPSLRFEYFLTLLKNAEFIIGNSSAGIREAPYYGVPSINLGSRQKNRASGDSIIHSDFSMESIKEAISQARSQGKGAKAFDFGQGNSNQLFLEIISNPEFWTASHQKQFNDLPL